jgi:ABC-type Fe3+/spermidine/putrescine transport system ATPase subunit
MIELRTVCLKADAFHLRNLELNVQQGEYVALMGRTGKGKTTVLEIIAGLRRIQSGSIHIAGEDVTRLPPAQRGVGYVPQDLALFPTMTVQQNLDFALRLRGGKADAHLQKLIDWLGLAPLLTRRVTHLSGGEAQRTALGRALAFKPRVLLLDEPFSALDEATRDHMYRLMQHVREHTPVTVLHVTHSRAEALSLADRVLSMDDLTPSSHQDSQSHSA